MAGSLEERPERNPTDPGKLDEYERLIEINRLAGDPQKAADLFHYGLGGYQHLGRVLGECARGLRIVSSFSSDGIPVGTAPQLAVTTRSLLATAWGMFAKHLGDLGAARRAFAVGNDLDLQLGNSCWVAIGLQNLAMVELNAGHWAAALRAAKEAMLHSSRCCEDTQDFPPSLAAVREARRARLGHNYRDPVTAASQGCSHTYLASSLAGLGDIAGARFHFGQATDAQGLPIIHPFRRIYEADFRLLLGDPAGARMRAEECKSVCISRKWAHDLARCETILGRCAVASDIGLAIEHLNTAREYADTSGDVEITLRCYLLAAEIARNEGNFSHAASDALDGIQLADSCQFGAWSLDLRAELATIYLAAGQPSNAIEPAGWVLERSQELDCQYAWGVANSLHLLGVAHARLGDSTKACDYFTRAVEKRKSFAHPDLAETEAELAKLS